MSLEQEIKEIREEINTGRIISESAISQGVVLRLLRALGWPIHKTQTVSPQYNLPERGYVDFALCHPPEKPLAFIEVKNVTKNVTQGDGSERQLFEYAFHKGVPLAILTNGRKWKFFLPAEQGNYAERCVYELDIVGHDLSECVRRLIRYLKYNATCSGEAINAIREDYREVFRKRQIEAALPQAWTQLVKNKEKLLLDLVADQVKSLCDYTPDNESVASFLLTTLSSPVPTPSPKPSAPPTSLSPVPQTKSSECGFVMHGMHYPALNARAVLVEVFEELTKINPSFLEKFASNPKHGRLRRYLARDPKDLHPNTPELEHLSRQLKSGWWINTHHSIAGIRQIIKMACEHANVKYGSDLIVTLPDKKRRRQL